MEEIKELSALDLHYLIKEFKPIVGSRVDNIYQKEASVFIVFHVPSIGKKILKIMLPNYIYLTDFKEEMPEKPPQFCVIARKYLKGARLIEISQIGFERILKLTFTAKEMVFYLAIELFSKGNIIICNKEMKIIYPMSVQKWKDRTIKGGLMYSYPKKEIDVFKASKEDLQNLLRNTSLDSIVVFLATEIGFGGKYAEVICINAKIDKKASPKSIDVDKLYSSITSLLETTKPELNSNLDKFLTERSIIQENTASNKVYSDKKTKVEKIIEMQTESIKKQEAIIEESGVKADLVYQNYKLIADILAEMKEIKKKYSWDEIKAKLKSHKIIKGIEEKSGKITLEIN